jgi:hypothetical protein
MSFLPATGKGLGAGPPETVEVIAGIPLACTTTYRPSGSTFSLHSSTPARPHGTQSYLSLAKRTPLGGQPEDCSLLISSGTPAPSQINSDPCVPGGSARGIFNLPAFSPSLAFSSTCHLLPHSHCNLLPLTLALFQPLTAT